MSQTDTSTPTYRDRMARLAALAAAMPSGEPDTISDDKALAMLQAIERVKRGTR